jgi:hypothetical protein
MNNEEHMIQVLEKIIKGCNEVKEDPDCHKDAKSLASLIIRDCNFGLRGAQENVN